MQGIFLRADHKANLSWEFKEKGYRYNRIIFKLDAENLIVEFKASRGFKSAGGKDHTAILKRFRRFTALEAIQRFNNIFKTFTGPGAGGRPFEDGIKQVYRDLGLPICKKKEIREL